MIFKRGNTWWYKFRWSIKADGGKRQRYMIEKTAHTKNKRDAQDVAREHRRALSLGHVHPSDPWPKPLAMAAPVCRSFAREFLQYAKASVKPGTHRFYSQCVARLQNFPAIANEPLSSITGETISRYARYRAEIAQNSAVTINGDVRTLRRMLRLAHEWGRLASAPPVHELPQATGRERVLSFTEEARYMAKCSANLRDAAILAVDTGLRPNSELLTLRWSDVDLTVRPETPHGIIHVRFGKTVNAQRTVPLSPRGAEVLKCRRGKAADSAFVFPGNGRSGHIGSLQHPHEKAVKDASLEAFPFYCWRHTFGTRAAQSGMDRFSLARLMGHSSPAVAARYYVHVTETHVAEGFGKFLTYHAEQVSKGISEAFPESTAQVQ